MSIHVPHSKHACVRVLGGTHVPALARGMHGNFVPGGYETTSKTQVTRHTASASNSVHLRAFWGRSWRTLPAAFEPTTAPVASGT